MLRIRSIYSHYTLCVPAKLSIIDFADTWNHHPVNCRSPIQLWFRGISTLVLQLRKNFFQHMILIHYYSVIGVDIFLQLTHRLLTYNPCHLQFLIIRSHIQPLRTIKWLMGGGYIFADSFISWILCVFIVLSFTQSKNWFLTVSGICEHSLCVLAFC
jgi:hypothetical protein